jgi:hypothetical protein
MDAGANDILILRERIARTELRRLASSAFTDMVKYVADIARGVIAIGGDLHADAEARLIADGSRQEDLWGANYYPGRGSEDCIEYTSLINIRPARGNRSMEVLDEGTRERIRELTGRLVGRGEDLDS